MYTGNVWGIALLLAGFLATLIGLELLLAAVLASRAAAGARAVRERPVASGATGAAALVALALAAAALGQFGGPGKFLSGLVLLAAAFPVVLGLACVARVVGERMPSAADATSPWRATLRGAVTLGLAFVTPFAGWFVVLPLAAATGLGGLVLSLFRSAQAAPAAPAPAPAAA